MQRTNKYLSLSILFLLLINTTPAYSAETTSVPQLQDAPQNTTQDPKHQETKKEEAADQRITQQTREQLKKMFEEYQRTLHAEKRDIEKLQTSPDEQEQIASCVKAFSAQQNALLRGADLRAAFEKKYKEAQLTPEEILEYQKAYDELICKHHDFLNRTIDETLAQTHLIFYRNLEQLNQEFEEPEVVYARNPERSSLQNKWANKYPHALLAAWYKVSDILNPDENNVRIKRLTTQSGNNQFLEITNTALAHHGPQCLQNALAALAACQKQQACKLNDLVTNRTTKSITLQLRQK